MNSTNTQSQNIFRRLFSNFGEKLQIAITRFPLTFACVIAVAVLFVLAIHTDTDNIYMKWIMAGVVSAFGTLAIYLFAEYRLKKLLTTVINTVFIGLIFRLFSTFSNNISDANATQFVILTVSFFLAMFFVGYISEKNSLRWWNNLQDTLFHLVISAFFAGVLMAGLSLAIVSLDKLFGLKIDDEVYAYLAVFCFVLFMPSYFLSQLSEKSASDESFSISYPVIFKILGLYILLPILAIYTLILYGYLFKIIASWELPNGWVSWLVSILGFVGFLTMVILHPLNLKGENKIIRFFSRFFPLIFFPLLVLMLVGIVRRFSDYGITINRLLVLILNIWFFGISIYLFISRSRQPKWILISFATIALLSAVGPWSVINLTEKSLKNELSQLLSDANWTNSDASQIKTLDTAKQIRLSDVAYYLQRTYGIESIRPMFSSLGENATVENMLNKLEITDPQIVQNNYFTVNMPQASFDFDVTDYKKAIYLLKNYDKNEFYKSDSVIITLENGNIKLVQNNIETKITLDPIIDKALPMKGNSLDAKDLTIENSDYKLIIFNLDGQRKAENQVQINYITGILLLK